jgi:hypothetical protein
MADRKESKGSGTVEWPDGPASHAFLGLWPRVCLAIAAEEDLLA